MEWGRFKSSPGEENDFAPLITLQLVAVCNGGLKFMSLDLRLACRVGWSWWEGLEEPSYVRRKGLEWGAGPWKLL